MKERLTHLYFGNGKGKTTAAMGHAAQSRVNENFLWQNSAELALTLLPKKGKTNG